MQFIIYFMIVSVISALFIGLALLIRKWSSKWMFAPTVLLLGLTGVNFYLAYTTSDLGAIAYVLFGLTFGLTTVFVFIFTLLIALGIIFKSSPKK